MANKYRNGETIYQLAQEFGISRHTVSLRLKKVGVIMRLHPPANELVNEMVELYESGLSLAEVGSRTSTSPGTVRRYLLLYGVRTRDFHGQNR